MRNAFTAYKLLAVILLNLYFSSCIPKGVIVVELVARNTRKCGRDKENPTEFTAHAEKRMRMQCSFGGLGSI